MRFVFLDQVHGLLRLGNPDPDALESREEVHPHARIRGIVVGQVGEEVAQGEAQVPLLEAEQHATGLRPLGDVGDLSFADGGLRRGDYARRGHARVDVEIDPAPPLDRRALALAQHLELALHEHAVRDDDGFPVARLDRGEAPADVGHAADHVVDLDPVAHADRVVQLQGEAAEHVAQRVLHGEGKHRGDYRRGGEDAPQVEPEAAQVDQRQDDVGARNDKVLDDAWRAQTHQRQQQAEDREPAEAHHRDRSHHQEHREQHLGRARVVHRLRRRAGELSGHSEDEEGKRGVVRGPLQGPQPSEDNYKEQDRADQVRGLGPPEFAQGRVHGLARITMPFAASAATSASAKPASARISPVCWPRRGAGSLTVAGVAANFVVGLT